MYKIKKNRIASSNPVWRRHFAQATRSNWDRQVVHFPFSFVGCEDGVGTCERTKIPATLQPQYRLGLPAKTLEAPKRANAINGLKADTEDTNEKTSRVWGGNHADTPNQTLPYNLVSLHCSSPTCVFGFLQYNKHCLRGLLAETEKHLVVPTQSFSPLLSTTGTQQTRTPPFPTSPPLPTAPAPVCTPPPPS